MASVSKKNITKPSITRISRRAGVKSLGDDCYNPIRTIMQSQLDKLIKAVLIVNSEHQTRTIMSDDVYGALTLLGINVTQSTDLNIVTCNK